MKNLENKPKAIETEYKGFRFRSRLEARWAVFMDQIGIDWEYEPEGYELSSGDRYLPDFWIPMPLLPRDRAGCFLEIKGPRPNQAEIDKCRVLAKDTGHTVYLVYGSIVNERFETITFRPVRAGVVITDVAVSDSRWQFEEMNNPDSDFYKDMVEMGVINEGHIEGLGFSEHWVKAVSLWTGQNRTALDHHKVDRAISACRGARFEFGESGV